MPPTTTGLPISFGFSSRSTDTKNVSRSKQQRRGAARAMAPYPTLNAYSGKRSRRGWSAWRRLVVSCPEIAASGGRGTAVGTGRRHRAADGTVRLSRDAGIVDTQADRGRDADVARVVDDSSCGANPAIGVLGFDEFQVDAHAAVVRRDGRP